MQVDEIAYVCFACEGLILSICPSQGLILLSCAHGCTRTASKIHKLLVLSFTHYKFLCGVLPIIGSLKSHLSLSVVN